jgi:hypothetical protein
MDVMLGGGGKQALVAMRHLRIGKRGMTIAEQMRRNERSRARRHASPLRRWVVAALALRCIGHLQDLAVAAAWSANVCW